MKKFKGFTLVELIVVIAIIGVLAAILVPNMMGYISKSKLSSANTAAKNVQTALVTYKADQESMGNKITLSSSVTTKGEKEEDDTTVSTWKVASDSTDGAKAAVYTALQGNSNMGVVAFGEVTLTGNTEKVIWAQWGDSESPSVWGQYPNAQADYTTFNNATKTFGSYVESWTVKTND